MTTDLTPPAIFSTVLATPDREELPKPDAGPYYVLDGKDIYVHRNTRLGRVLARLDKRPDQIKPYNIAGFMWQDIPPISPELIGRVLGFFRHVWDIRHAEAMVMLTIDNDNNYDLLIPDQRVTGTSIAYDLDATAVPDDRTLIGTIHSHCNMSAFHSHTDEGDADQRDGIHITIGHVSSNKPDYAVMVSFNGTHWQDFKLEDVTDPGAISIAEFPHNWLDKVTDAPPPQPKPAYDYPASKPYSSYDRRWKPGDNSVSKYTPTSYKPPQPYQQAFTDFWPADSDYSHSQSHAAEQLAYDLELMQRIAAKRGLRLRYKLTVRGVTQPPVAKSSDLAPDDAANFLDRIYE